MRDALTAVIEESLPRNRDCSRRLNAAAATRSARLALCARRNSADRLRRRSCSHGEATLWTERGPTADAAIATTRKEQRGRGYRSAQIEQRPFQLAARGKTPGPAYGMNPKEFRPDV